MTDDELRDRLEELRQRGVGMGPTTAGLGQLQMWAQAYLLGVLPIETTDDDPPPHGVIAA